MKLLTMVLIINCFGICQAAASEISRCTLVKTNVGMLVSFEASPARGQNIFLQGVLMKPVGKKPAPAIVLLHGVFGMEAPDCYTQEQQRYADMGYASLLVDSTSVERSYRIGDNPTTINGYDNADQIADAVSALEFLSRQPFIDRKRIALVGHAHGGSSVIRGVVGDPTFVSASKRGQEFSAAIALHPACPTGAHRLVVPTLIIIGEKDNVNSAKACQGFEGSALAPSNVQLRVIKGAGHNFDVSWFAEFSSGATKAAYREITIFLTKHFERSRE